MYFLLLSFLYIFTNIWQSVFIVSRKTLVIERQIPVNPTFEETDVSLAFLQDSSEDQRRYTVLCKGFVLHKRYWILCSQKFLAVKFYAHLSIWDFKRKTCLSFSKMYMLGFSMFHLLIKAFFPPNCELSPYGRLPVLCIKLSAYLTMSGYNSLHMVGKVSSPLRFGWSGKCPLVNLLNQVLVGGLL